jgi:8-amino-3,8-dideoxy-alpha-D-manno-octulosonate transaminase
MSLPTVVEIEINSDCNMACSYCPNSLAKRVEEGQMSDHLFEKILNDLKNAGYTGKIAFDFYNEPTLAKNFSQRVKRVKEVLPFSFLEIYSNGTRLNSKNAVLDFIKLGIDKFIITKHEGIKKLAFEKIYDDLSLQEKAHFELRGFESLTLTNRGGSLEHIEKKQSQLPCYIPDLVMTITVKGKVLPCFEDFYQSQEMGDVGKESLIDIWNSKRYKEFRRKLREGKRSEFKICKNCNRISESMKLQSEKHLIGDDEIAAVEKVLRSGRLYRYHDESECEAFEKAFASYIGVKHAVLVNSGTNALVAALMASGVGPGDEVIIPAYTFAATANAVLNVGAIPVVVNINERLTLDLLELERAVTDQTKAIIPVHMDGKSAEIKEMISWAKLHNIILIEDVAQAMGASYQEKKLGSFGDFGCFSLNVDKVLTTGEGGVVVTNSTEQYKKLLCLSDNGLPYGEFEEKYFSDFSPFVGVSMRVSEITGTLARIQLKKIQYILSLYKERKEAFEKELNGAKNFCIQRAYNKEGECGLRLYLEFKSNESCQSFGRVMRDQKILCYPPYIRRAHVAWKWNKLLGENSEIDRRRNSFHLTNKKYNYHKVHFLKSIDHSLKILIIDIDITKSMEYYAKIISKIKQIDEEFTHEL